MLKLVSDNSALYYDSELKEYTEEKPTLMPYSLIDDEGIILGLFPTYKGAITFQMGMGLRATTEILIEEEI